MLNRMIRTNKKKLCWLGAIAVSGFAVTESNAALTLTFSEPGYGTVTQSAVVGTNNVAYVTPYGDYSTNILVGYSNSNAPGSIGQLQIQSLDVSTTATSPKSLTITLTDTGFTFPGAIGQTLNLTGSLGGTITPPTAGDTVTFSSSATPSSGPATTTAPQTYVVPGSVFGTASFNVPTAASTFIETGSYTLSDTISVALNGSNKSLNLSGTTTVTAVPEPVGLSIVGLAGAALLGRRRKH